MAATLKSDLFVPEIATAVATAEFPNQLVLGFAGSPFVSVLPGADSLGDEGDIIKFPRYDVLGDFDDMVEDTALVPERLRTSMDMAVVQAGGKAVEITDFASLAARGDPSTEVGRQVPVLAQRYIDRKLVDEASTTPLVYDGSAATFTWDNFVNAIITKWGDSAMDNVGGIIVHSKQMGDIMKLDEFKEYQLLGMPGSLINGFVGNIGRYPVYVSDRVTTSAGPVYNALILKRGSIGIKFQRQLLVESFRDVLKKNWVISADVRFAVHLFYGTPYPAIKFVTQ